MAKHSLLVGSTSWIDYVRITDMNGSPITGLVWNSTGLLSKYVLSGAASVAITLATQTVTGAYSSGGFVEIDATAFPGLYRLDIPNAALASGNKSYVSLYGYSGMNVTMCEYDLVAYNPQDAVRLGLTALPNAAAEASGGLYTRGTGAGQINQPANGMIDGNVVRWLGTAASTPTVAGVPNVNVKTWNDLTTVALPLIPTVAGRTLDVASTGEAGLDFDNIKAATAPTTLTNIRVPNVTLTDTVTTYTGNTVQTGDNFARIGAAGAGLTALGDTRIANLDATISSRLAPAGTLAAVTLVSTLTTYTGNTPQTGDSFARLGAAGAGLTALGDTRIANLDATVSSRTKPADTQAAVTLVGSVSGSVGSVASGVSLTAGQLAIKKNTALANFEFPMTDSTTNAPKTGLTVTATRSIDGGAFAACANAVTAVSNGVYKISLDATDLNGTVITLRFTAALANDRLITIIPQA